VNTHSRHTHSAVFQFANPSILPPPTTSSRRPLDQCGHWCRCRSQTVQHLSLVVTSKQYFFSAAAVSKPWGSLVQRGALVTQSSSRRRAAQSDHRRKCLVLFHARQSECLNETGNKNKQKQNIDHDHSLRMMDVTQRQQQKSLATGHWLLWLPPTVLLTTPRRRNHHQQTCSNHWPKGLIL
jgi:hypothetical protein